MQEVSWTDLQEVTLHLVRHLTDRHLAVSAAGQDPDRPLRRELQTVSRRVVQAEPASPVTLVRSVGSVSGMAGFHVRVFRPRLRPAQARAQRPSAKGPAEVGLEAQVDQGVVKGGGFGKHSRHGKRYWGNCVRIHKGRPHGYGGIRTPCYQEAYAHGHGELSGQRTTC